MFALARWLDRHAFLRYRLWEFGLHNVRRWFPWYFLRHGLARHPVRFVRGIRAYCGLVRQSEGGPLSGNLDMQALREWAAAQTGPEPELLIAPGFCMKPYNAMMHRSSCPAGHFSHDCRMFEDLNLLVRDRQQWPQPCCDCAVGELAQWSAFLRADFYIMTSAIDIARNLYLPALRGNGPRVGCFLLCAYSAEAFTFGLSASGMRGLLITFCGGDCLNHRDFTRADIGIKEKQTVVDPTVFAELRRELLALGKGAGQLPSLQYMQIGNVYRVL